MTSLLLKISFKYLVIPVKHNTRTFIYSSKKGLNRDFIARMQQPIDLSWPSILQWIQKKQMKRLKIDHSFVQERHEFLGPDLATAHFVVARGGAVRFKGIDEWFEMNDKEEIGFPRVKIPDMFVEAIDVSGTSMMYQSFDNYVRLRHLKYLDVSNCELVDDWCLDRFIQFRDTLLYLDISGCPLVTENGLACLHKLKKLKRLKMAGLPQVESPNLIALMLEEAMPGCVVELESTEQQTASTECSMK